MANREDTKPKKEVTATPGEPIVVARKKRVGRPSKQEVLAREEEKKEELTLAELTGIDNKKVLNERVARLLNIIENLEKVTYGEQYSYIGSEQDRLLFKSSVEERLVEQEDDEYRYDYDLKQLSLNVGKVEGDDPGKLNLLKQLKAALDDLHIGYWPEKDDKGNDLLIIDYPKDLEVLRKIFSPEFFIDYKHTLEEKRNLLLKEKRRKATQKQIQHIQELLVNIESREGFLIDENVRIDTDPIRGMFAFGSLRISKATENQIKSELRREKSFAKQELKDRGEEPLAVDEYIDINTEKFNLGDVDWEEKMVVAESSGYEPRIPSLAKMPYYKKYRWFNKEDFIKWARRQNLEIDDKKLGTGKVLFDTENGEVVTREDREQNFLAARDYESGNTDSVNALREVFLMNKSLIIYFIHNLKEKVWRRYGQIPGDDLFQMGNLAILTAVKNYSPDVATKDHVAYLASCLESFMKKLDLVGAGMSNNLRQVRSDSHAEQRIKAVDDIKAELRSHYPGRKIENIEVAREMAKRGLINFLVGSEQGESREKVLQDQNQLLSAYQKYLEENFYLYTQVPYEEVFEKADLSSVDMLGNNLVSHPEQERQVFLNDLSRELEKVFYKLTPREERVLRMRFGIGIEGRENAALKQLSGEERNYYESLGNIGKRKYIETLIEEGRFPDFTNKDSALYDYKTLEEIGHVFGVTRERVRSIEGMALRRIKGPVTSRRLAHLLPDNDYYHPDNVRKRKLEEMRARMSEHNTGNN
jgi:RNA polymerase sigma factor (sigma-70 family)